jgi:hypothetical protein
MHDKQPYRSALQRALMHLLLSPDAWKLPTLLFASFTLPRTAVDIIDTRNWHDVACAEAVSNKTEE